MKRSTNAKKKKKKIINGFCKENSQVQRFFDVFKVFISYLFKAQNVNKELESRVGGRRERERTEGEQDKNSIRICPNKMSVLG